MGLLASDDFRHAIGFLAGWSAGCRGSYPADKSSETTRLNPGPPGLTDQPVPTAAGRIVFSLVGGGEVGTNSPYCLHHVSNSRLELFWGGRRALKRSMSPNYETSRTGEPDAEGLESLVAAVVDDVVL